MARKRKPKDELPKSESGKRPIDMTSDELALHVFPPEVVEQLKKIAHQKDKPEVPHSS